MATSVTLKPNAIDISGSTSGTTTLQASAVAGTTTLTLPAATDTLVGKATTDTLTNKTLTGAVMNGTLGATTPSTASVTTLTTSSTVTHSGGTANGVAYLDGSKVLTTGSALTFNGSALAVTGTASATTFYPTSTSGVGIQMTTTGNNNGNWTIANNYGQMTIATEGAAGSLVTGSSQGAALFGNSSNVPAQFFTNNIVRATLDASGNLGLGVTPSAWSGALAKGISINYGGGIASHNSANVLYLTANAYYNSAWYYKNNGYANSFNICNNDGSFVWNTAASGTAGNAITFTQAMTLDASGNLGVGTTSPSQRLTIAQTNGYPVIDFKNSGTGYGDIGFQVDKMVLSAYSTTPLTFWTNSNERARIDSSGSFLVGATSNSTTTVTGFKVNSPTAGHWDPAVVTSGNNASYSCWDIYSTGAGAYRFYVTTTGVINATSTTITAISDERLKENIRDLDYGLASVMALKPRKFDWKEGKGQDKKNVAGFIAQEFENVFPECVGKSKAGDDGIEYKNINHEALIPTLVKAIQELKAEIDSLKSQLNGA